MTRKLKRRLCPLNNIRKFVFYLKKSGLRQTVKLVLDFIVGKLRLIFFGLCASLCGGKVKATAKKLKGKTVIVFTPSVEWFFLFQRAQQLAVKYASHEGVAVIFLTTQCHYDSFAGIKELEPDLFLVNHKLAGSIDILCKDAKQVITSVFNIAGIPLTQLYHSDKLEYEYVDDISVTVSGADDLESKRKIHDDIMRSADLVVATASKLYDEALTICKKVVFSPNAADYDFFSAPAAPCPEYKNLHEKYSCVLEYYGALASWFDYELVEQVAKKRPDWVWVLIGKKIDNDMERSKIEKLPNVIYVPAVPYKKLPEYISCADIMTIPFVINEITEATSPVKLFEYMASAKSIITSDMNECRRYESVSIYHDADEFVALAEKALAEKNSEAHLALLDREAKANTWDSRAEDILKALNVI